MNSDIDLERTVLGLAMVWPNKTLIDFAAVRPEHFQSVQCGALWRLITQMDASGDAISIQTVAANLGRVPVNERRGVDASWLYESSTFAQFPEQAETVCRQLINSANLNALSLALTRAQQVTEGATDAPATLETVRALIDQVAADRATGTMIGDSIAETVARFDEETPVIPTPWDSLNDIIGGWRPGALYVVGARPGAGKTIFGVQAALGLAQYGYVALNTLEMDKHEINQRAISHAGEVWISHLQGAKNGKSAMYDWERDAVKAVAPVLADLPISVQDDPNATPLTVRAHARSLTRKGPLMGIVVDYLQLMEPDGRDQRPRHEIVASYSRALKKLAKEMSCPVIALSQLNRGGAGSDPSLTHLKESGSLEQDADVVILLSQPEIQEEDGSVRLDELNLRVSVAKNRHGPHGSFTIQRNGGKSTIGALEQRPHHLESGRKQADDATPF